MRRATCYVCCLGAGPPPQNSSLLRRLTITQHPAFKPSSEDACATQQVVPGVTVAGWHRRRARCAQRPAQQPAATASPPDNTPPPQCLLFFNNNTTTSTPARTPASSAHHAVRLPPAAFVTCTKSSRPTPRCPILSLGPQPAVAAPARGTAAPARAWCPTPLLLLSVYLPAHKEAARVVRAISWCGGGPRGGPLLLPGHATRSERSSAGLVVPQPCSTRPPLSTQALQQRCAPARRHACCACCGRCPATAGCAPPLPLQAGQQPAKHGCRPRADIKLQVLGAGALAF